MAVPSAPPTSAEHPWPVRVVAMKIATWVSRLGAVWVEGQVAQLTRRRGAGLCFLVLRDTDSNVSLSVTCARGVLDGLAPPLAEGARVVVLGKPDFYARRGTLSLRATEIRPVGVGELLARLERLRALLAAEGLFAPERKRPLPFLPRRVGLITGRESAAERDVLKNARARWPAVPFDVVNVPVQGPAAAAAVIDALSRLDADPAVDVIVLARGGGSFEDLLPFSDEGLCRAVASCRTPVVSGIGHESDTPLVDFVADVRASTPTDAARRVVPDVAEQRNVLAERRRRLRHAIAGRVGSETATLEALRGRPVLAHPETLVRHRAEEVAALRRRSRQCFGHRLETATADVGHVRARVLALSPAATLTRGYAVVQGPDGSVVRSSEEAPVGASLGVRLARGRLQVEVTGSQDGEG